MENSIEKEIEALWILTSDNLNNEGNEAFEDLQEDYKIMHQLGIEEYMIFNRYLWKVKMSHMFIS